jgi:hypothetical protein
LPFLHIQEALMVLKKVFSAVICATMLALSGVSVADEYRPGEFLGLNLSAAVLSPKPLGPAAGFVPGPLDVTIDRDSNTVRASVEPAAESKIEPKTERQAVVRSVRVAHPRAEPPRHAAATKLARQHRNPLDAQAFDARIQVWPCKSGGICNWRR